MKKDHNMTETFLDVYLDRKCSHLRKGYNPKRIFFD